MGLFDFLFGSDESSFDAEYYDDDSMSGFDSYEDNDF